ncbi:MAG: hypothetical protein IH948_05755 [Bacteroidetes bacterium]|nr:hypothetical protein [Bacteroidota bacterium]
MKVIADSGSSKCNWAIVSSDRRIDTDTMGLNPFYHNEVKIEETLRKNIELSKVADEIKKVYFYCAGCSSDDLKSTIIGGLQRVFSQASINVEHDMVSASYATYTGEPCIVCILGTGSNSVFFDGKETREEFPALGYIMGDEGSGSYFGKQLLKDFLYKDLPIELEDKFHHEFRLDKNKILDNVLSKPNANVYLASFMPFLAEHKKYNYVDELIAEGFNNFLQRHVLCFERATEMPVHFVGSVAFYFKDELYKACSQLNLKVGTILRKPIDGLVKYHA